MNRKLKQDLATLDALTDGRYDLTILGQRLKAVRKARGLSQYWFSARAGIREKAYWQYESGNGLPPLQRLIAIANAHRIDLNVLLATDVEPPPPATEEDVL